jgi:hypothetical protein
MPEKDKGGRPTKLDDKVIEKLKEVYLIGATDAEAAYWAGIGAATLYRYLASNKKFREQRDAWKLNPFVKARNTVFKALETPKTARWFLERKLRKEFAARLEISPADDTDQEKSPESKEALKSLIKKLQDYDPDTLQPKAGTD